MMRMVKPILDGKVKSFEVKASASVAYNDGIQGRLRESVWMGCNSYYRSGISFSLLSAIDANFYSGGDGKIYATYPGPVSRFWWNTLVPKWDDYKVYGVQGWSPANKLFGLLKALFVL
jgi:hypothetical protein